MHGWGLKLLAGADAGRKLCDEIRQEIGKVIVGQTRAIEGLLVALLSGGHVLIEGVPGMAKTLLVRALAYCIDADFRRIQFTPDLMPSDVVGTNVFSLQTGKFHLKKGPIFTNVLLADEINRTPPKTQSALLESMEERQVTIDGVTHELADPFLVVATQNPIEYEGTYPLPEAQLDRFGQKIVIDYPSEDEEREILARHHTGFSPRELAKAGMKKVATTKAMLAHRKAVEKVLISDEVLAYIETIIRATRRDRNVSLGASPRAGVSLLLSSKALALLRGRDFVTPDDVKHMALPVVRHRIMLLPEAELEGVDADGVLGVIVESVAVPR